MEKETMLKISAPLAQAVLDYLSHQPYKEVFTLVAAVRNLEKIEEEPEPDNEK